MVGESPHPAAVQDWVDGDVALSKGIIFKATSSVENGSTYNYRTFASFNRASYKPSLSVTYNLGISLDYSTIDVDENQSFTLTATTIPAGQTVTWSSSNTTVATVSSAGKISARKAGKTTITAKLSDGTQDACTVYVTLADGIYYIENVGAGCYLGTSGSTTNGTNAYLKTKDTSATGRLSQLWKITYVSGGEYTVRPMNRQASGLYMSGTNVNVTNINIADSFSAVPTQAQWQIYYTVSGYAILNNSSSNTMLMAASASNGANVGVATTSSSSTYFWSFERAYGTFWYDTSTMYPAASSEVAYLELGSSSSLAGLGLALQTYGTTTSRTWTSSNTSVAIVDSTGKVTSVGRGESTITVTTMIYGTTYTHQYNLIVKETIYVKNYYDSSLASNATLIGYIDEAVDFLNTVYSSDFYLFFEMDGLPTRYTNAAIDICPIGTSSDCDDSCSADCSNHCKNVFRIANELDDAWETNHIIVMWSNTTDNVFCYADFRDYTDEGWGYNYGHIPVSATGFVPNHRPVIQILSINQLSVMQSQITEFTTIASMSVVLAHEVAHTLGLKEVATGEYADTPDHVADGAALCIMSYPNAEEYDDIMEANHPLCNFCFEHLAEEIADNVYQEQ